MKWNLIRIWILYFNVSDLVSAVRHNEFLSVSVSPFLPFLHNAKQQQTGFFFFAFPTIIWSWVISLKRPFKPSHLWWPLMGTILVSSRLITDTFFGVLWARGCLLTRAKMNGWTNVRTSLSEPKFLGRPNNYPWCSALSRVLLFN